MVENDLIIKFSNELEAEMTICIDPPVDTFILKKGEYLNLVLCDFKDYKRVLDLVEIRYAGPNFIGINVDPSLRLIVKTKEEEYIIWGR